MKKNISKPIAFLMVLMMLAGLTVMQASADGTNAIGEVTVTHVRNVNLRSGDSTDYPIIGTAKPGELFQTTRQTPTGWYEIIRADGSYAFISSTLVYFYPYPSAVPVGTQYTVPVQYRTPQGQVLKTVDVPVKAGQNVITANDILVPGYRLVSTRSVYVWVDNMGKATPNGVIFNYEFSYQQATNTPAVQATLPIYYRNIYNQILASEYRTLPPGTHLVQANASKIPAGYYVSGASDAVVFVSYYGTAAPDAVNFVLSQSIAQTPRPVSAEVSVSYRDEMGNVLYSTKQSLSPGYATVTADDSRVPYGMTLTSSRSVMVYVSDQGIAYPSGIVFTYRAASQADIQVIYRDNAYRNLYAETILFTQGTHTVTADDSRVPVGYVLQSARSVQVTVYANGTVSQNQVVFTYGFPVAASLAVEYRDSEGRNLFTESMTLSAGTYTISANDSRVPGGYVLRSDRSVRVTVYSNGAISQNRIVFLYGMPASGSVNVVYRDGAGNQWFNEYITLQEGTHTISADDGRMPGNYSLQSPRSAQVSIRADGSASPSQVVFTYHMTSGTTPAPITPVTGTVNVVYRDGAGNIWFDDYITLPQGTHTISVDDTRMPANYGLQSARNVQVSIRADGSASPSQVVFLYYLGVAANTPPAGEPGNPPPNIVPVTVLPAHQEFSYGGPSLPVYSGPGTQYFRAASGKATLGGGRVRVWGTQGDWAMIGYGLSNNLYRVGYIQKSALPAGLSVPELGFINKPVKVVSPANLTDDPIINPTWLFEIPTGTEVTLLAYENFVDHWAYIETTYNGQPIRGFVNKIRISAP